MSQKAKTSGYSVHLPTSSRHDVPFCSCCDVRRKIPQHCTLIIILYKYGPRKFHYKRHAIMLCDCEKDKVYLCVITRVSSALKVNFCIISHNNVSLEKRKIRFYQRFCMCLWIYHSNIKEKNENTLSSFMTTYSFVNDKTFSRVIH